MKLGKFPRSIKAPSTSPTSVWTTLTGVAYILCGVVQLVVGIYFMTAVVLFKSGSNIWAGGWNLVAGVSTIILSWLGSLSRSRLQTLLLTALFTLVINVANLVVMEAVEWRLLVTDDDVSRLELEDKGNLVWQAYIISTVCAVVALLSAFSTTIYITAVLCRNHKSSMAGLQAVAIGVYPPKKKFWRSRSRRSLPISSSTDLRSWVFERDEMKPASSVVDLPSLPQQPVRTAGIRKHHSMLLRPPPDLSFIEKSFESTPFERKLVHMESFSTRRSNNNNAAAPPRTLSVRPLMGKYRKSRISADGDEIINFSSRYPPVRKYREPILQSSEGEEPAEVQEVKAEVDEHLSNSGEEQQGCPHSQIQETIEEKVQYAIPTTCKNRQLHQNPATVKEQFHQNQATVKEQLQQNPATVKEQLHTQILAKVKERQQRGAQPVREDKLPVQAVGSRQKELSGQQLDGPRDDEGGCEVVDNGSEPEGGVCNQKQVTPVALAQLHTQQNSARSTFSRELKQALRPIDDILVSPHDEEFSDGSTSSTEELQEFSLTNRIRLQVTGRKEVVEHGTQTEPEEGTTVKELWMAHDSSSGYSSPEAPLSKDVSPFPSAAPSPPPANRNNVSYRIQDSTVVTVIQIDPTAKRRTLDAESVAQIRAGLKGRFKKKRSLSLCSFDDRRGGGPPTLPPKPDWLKAGSPSPTPLPRISFDDSRKGVTHFDNPLYSTLPLRSRLGVAQKTPDSATDPPPPPLLPRQPVMQVRIRPRRSDSMPPRRRPLPPPPTARLSPTPLTPNLEPEVDHTETLAYLSQLELIARQYRAQALRKMIQRRASQRVTNLAHGESEC